MRRVDVAGLPPPAEHLPLHVVGAVDLVAVVDGALEGMALGAQRGGGVGVGIGVGVGVAVVVESPDDGGEGGVFGDGVGGSFGF